MKDLFDVRVIAMTKPVVLDIPTTEDLIVYQSRVSNIRNQEKQLAGEKVISSEKFIASCKARGEWSVMQMANINLEIVGPRDITRQFTRHESMLVVEHDECLSFYPDGIDKHAGGVQEFSQRYSAVPGFVEREGRLADPDNRQSSIDDDATGRNAEFSNTDVLSHIAAEYQCRLDNGEAKETARVILPEGLTVSRLYVNATVRSWVHFLDVRERHETQKEHRQLAAQIREALHGVMPLLF
ncbi:MULTISPECIES: FAD-dependent thymidylate synthase [Paracoccus]|uniref:FAD-dependent thymidylate synthase n=1 Tax=Paracoccus TaxID=265 RepID=UPI00086A5D84|nr:MULTISPECIES: FAD-dependent thymidylate synthase [Paracoccus]ODT60987.1 MAG: hypothetical protein ABS73_03880 [Paracoccus sp. SCN 68-21]